MSGPLENDESREPEELAAHEEGTEHERNDETDESSAVDEFGELSLTWGSADPDFDQLLRERVGPIEPLPTPPYAFERVLMNGRRRRARKLWTAVGTAAFVVMAGTAGTTVVLASHGNDGVPTSTGSTTGAAPSPSTTASRSAPFSSPTSAPTSAAASASASASAVGGAGGATAGSSTTPQCLSTDFIMTATVKGGGSTSGALVLVLTNTSGHACITDGYPGIEFAPVVSTELQPVKESRMTSPAKTQITVAANATVYSVVDYTTVAPGATPGPGCLAPSYYVLAIPPNQQAQITEPISGGPITVCGTTVGVTALQLGIGS